MKIVTAVSAVLLSIILAGGPSQLAVAQDPVQNQISHALAAVPGGVQTARNQVLWPDGTLLVVPDNDTALTTAASATCPSGRFCAHSQAAGAGARLEFSTCPSTNSVGRIDGCPFDLERAYLQDGNGTERKHDRGDGGRGGHEERHQDDRQACVRVDVTTRRSVPIAEVKGCGLPQHLSDKRKVGTA